MLFSTRDTSVVSFLKQVLRECRPVRVWVFFSKAGKFHEIIICMNIKIFFANSVLQFIFAVIVLM